VTPFALEDFSARGFLMAAGFFGAGTDFLAGWAVFARAVDALGCAAFFFCAIGFAGFFEAFFFGELAINFGFALG
jgi:hypothetical protein